MNPPGPPDVDAATTASRRDAVFAELGEGVMVLPAAPIQYGSRDTERTYRPDSELYYLTGVTEPGTVAVLVGGDTREFVMFVPDRDPEAELWAGARLGPEAAAERFGPDRCHGLGDLEEELPKLLQKGDRVHFRLRPDDVVQRSVSGALRHARARGPRTGTGPRGLVDPGEILDELRLRKGPQELERLRRAAALSIAGHRAGAAVLGPEVGEWVVEAAVDAGFRAGGGRAGFGTIVGSGENACVLHYVENSHEIAEGDLVLVDAGAELGHYHGDVTRTYPASGHFVGAQLEVYEIVERARRAAVSAVRPGASVAEVHLAATRTLVEGLVGLGALVGDPGELIEEEAHKQYYPHQTSHWLGLDVHDPGDYARNGQSRVLEVGMVLTVEPGLYFRPGLVAEGAESLAGIGVRIEDDVAVTEDGCEVLTEELPTAPEEVAALVRDAT